MCSLILHGRKSLQLHKWRFVVNLLQNGSAFSINPSPNRLSSLSNSFSSASVSSLQDGLKGNNFTVSYLVDSLGFTTKLAESICKKVTKGDPDSVLHLLRSNGFADPQISTIITNYPRLLMLDTEKSLAPNLKFLQSRGASTSELTEILSKVPKILGMKGDKAVGRYYDFVKDIIEADKCSKYEMSCLSMPEGTRQENIIRNVLVLRRLGVPQKLLFSLLSSCAHIVSGKERFEESLKKVVDMGFDPTSSKFVEALRIVYQISDKTIEDKVNLYISLGFAVEDVWEMFKKYPFLLAISEENILNSFKTFMSLAFTRDEFVRVVKHCPQCIGLSAELVKKKTEFLVNKMIWSIEDVVSNPAVFCYSFEKRIVPRCSVIKALVTKGGGIPSVGYILVCRDEVFLNRYVRKHNDKELVAELMAIFTGEAAS